MHAYTYTCIRRIQPPISLRHSRMAYLDSNGDLCWKEILHLELVLGLGTLLPIITQYTIDKEQSHRHRLDSCKRCNARMTLVQRLRVHCLREYAPGAALRLEYTPGACVYGSVLYACACLECMYLCARPCYVGDVPACALCLRHVCAYAACAIFFITLRVPSHPGLHAKERGSEGRLVLPPTDFTDCNGMVLQYMPKYKRASMHHIQCKKASRDWRVASILRLLLQCTTKRRERQSRTNSSLCDSDTSLASPEPEPLAACRLASRMVTTRNTLKWKSASKKTTETPLPPTWAGQMPSDDIVNRGKDSKPMIAYTAMFSKFAC